MCTGEDFGLNPDSHVRHGSEISVLSKVRNQNGHESHSPVDNPLSQNWTRRTAHPALAIAVSEMHMCAFFPVIRFLRLQIALIKAEKVPPRQIASERRIRDTGWRWQS